MYVYGEKTRAKLSTSSLPHPVHRSLGIDENPFGDNAGQNVNSRCSSSFLSLVINKTYSLKKSMYILTQYTSNL